jgi:class 3 adenylate cyclase
MAAVRGHIGAKIIGPYLVLMVLLAFLGTFVVVRQVSNSLEQRFENQLLDAGTAVNQTVLKVEQEQTELIRLMANSEGVAEGIRSGDAAALQLLLVPLQVNSRYAMAEVLDAQGAQVLALRPSDGAFARAFDPQAGSWDISQWVLAGRTDDFGTKYSQLVNTTFGMMLYTGGAVRAADGTIAGAILVGLPIDELLARLTKDNLANVSLYAPDGALLASTLPGGLARDTLRITSSDYLGGVRTGSVVQRTITAQGNDYLELVGGLVVRDQVAAGMGVALPTGYIHQSSARTRVILSALFSVVVIAVLCIGLMLAGRITQPINVLVEACRRVSRGEFEAPVRVRSHDETGILANTFNDMVGGLRERDFIRDTFGRYMSKQVADQVLSGDLKLGGERKEVTLLMSDIRGFTTLSETMSPEQLVDFLNRYFGLMVGCVLDHEGVVDKYMGDAILAVFGAPIPNPRHAEQAALAALDMRRHLAAFNADLAEAGHAPIRIGIGINTGQVVAGNIGSEARMEYTVIGDAVNATQRIEDLTKDVKTDILVSDTSLAVMGGKFAVGAPHHVTLRGRTHETAIYPLRGLIDEASAAEFVLEHAVDLATASSLR